MNVLEQQTKEQLCNLDSKITKLTLRDLFAMSALNGMYANDTHYTDATYHDFAVMAYEQADEMLKAR